MVDELRLAPKGQIKLTTDPITLGQLDKSKLQSPQIKNTTGFKRAERYPHVLLDKIEVNQTLLVQVEDRAAGSDLAIVPVEINFHFFAHNKPGHFMKYGQTQLIKGEYGGSHVRIADCQFVKKEF